VDKKLFTLNFMTGYPLVKRLVMIKPNAPGLPLVSPITAGAPAMNTAMRAARKNSVGDISRMPVAI